MRPLKYILNYLKIQFENKKLLTDCDKKGVMVENPFCNRHVIRYPVCRLSLPGNITKI